ncbi:MAG: hypothetical protein GF308_20825 [Candidatus Heimdallarchaeota archaeon]|nr:hypothetical protein [Candidatus Heimdallarchaeota archaeon]
MANIIKQNSTFVAIGKYLSLITVNNLEAQFQREMVGTMNNNLEKNIYKQIEELSEFIIKALESLEKELSEYINVTDQRLQTLEDKVQNLESLTDVAGKGLVQAMEDKSIQEDKRPEPPASSSALPPEPLEKSSEHRRDISHQSTKEPLDGGKKKSDGGGAVERKESIGTIPQPPLPGSLNASIKSSETKKNNQRTAATQAIIPPTPEPREKKNERGKAVDKKGKEDSSIIDDEKDREELMSALKIIDSL